MKLRQHSRQRLLLYLFLILILDFPYLSLHKPALAQRHGRYDEFEAEEAEEAEEPEDLEPKATKTQEHVQSETAKPTKNKKTFNFEEESEDGSQLKDKISFGPTESGNYFPEILALIFIVVYVINFFIGRRTNEKVANSWVSTFRNLFETQFASIGLYEAQTTQADGITYATSSPVKGGSGLLKESQSCFKFYASGRRHCHCLLATLELRKRHDLFSLFLSLIDLSPIDDSVTLEIPMSDTAMDPFVFAIVRRRQERKIRKSTKDLENFSSVVKSAVLQPSLCILTDSPELEREFLDDPVTSTLKESEDLFVMLHFTDQNPTPPFCAGVPSNKKLLKFKFNLPPINQMESLKRLMKMAIYFIDRVAEKKLSAQAKLKALNQRKLVAEKLFKASHIQRQEALIKKKEELRRREEEANAKVVLSPEAQRKREIREHKAALKRSQPRVKIIR